jgi:UDP-2,4-diacetamido-2,4,6-trideoxy-beta-L-altropyranose hydrolase
MRLAFRADASSKIGTGHVMRCLTLADSLREKGADCKFVCREHDGHLIDLIRSREYTVYVLPNLNNNVPLISGLTHAHWLGVDWQTDAKQTILALKKESLDWLVVDHYALDHRWELALRPSCQRLMVIDDLADRRHDCDLLLDQNYGSSPARYGRLVARSCTQCYGPSYALLKSVYAERQAKMPQRDGQVRRALIYFGGSADENNLTGTAVQAFLAPQLAYIQLDVVVSETYALRPSLEDTLKRRGKATIHRQLPDLAELMAQADISIGAGGATTWERCCMGLPSIIVVCALNQKAIGEAIKNSGAGIVLYPSDKLSAEIKRQVLDLCEDTARYLEMSRKATQICDGFGVHRIVEYLK